MTTCMIPFFDTIVFSNNTFWRGLRYAQEVATNMFAVYLRSAYNTNFFFCNGSYVLGNTHTTATGVPWFGLIEKGGCRGCFGFVSVANLSKNGVLNFSLLACLLTRKYRKMAGA